MSLSIWQIKEKDIKNINEIIKGEYKNLEERSNPIGPAVFWFESQQEAYYINGKQLTKQQFITHRTSQRIKLING